MVFAPESEFLERGTPAFRRASLALFLAGFATFALMYTVQPVLPELAKEFSLSAAVSSLAVSVTTGSLAIGLLLVGALSEGLIRRAMIAGAILVTSILGFAVALAPTWGALLAVRALQGIVFAGAPSLAMAYVVEEVHPSSVGRAMGRYIAGTALGAMSGRVVTALLTDAASWRVGVAAVGAIGLLAGMVVWRVLPPSVRFRPQAVRLRGLAAGYREHLSDAGRLALFGEAFLLMGAIVTMYNYIAFRLVAAPFALSQSAAGAVFTLYLVGMAGSAWAGTRASQSGYLWVLRVSIALMLAGIVLSGADRLAAAVAGLALLTFGFFGAHAVASSWVGARARRGRGQASSLYLLTYYLGSAIAGTTGGLFWAAWGWNGVVGFIVGLLSAALVLTLPLAGAHDGGPAARG